MKRIEEHLTKCKTLQIIKTIKFITIVSQIELIFMENVSQTFFLNEKVVRY